MTLIVVTEKNPTTAIITMFRRCMILLLPLSVVLIKYFPSIGRSPHKHWGPDSWIGVATHKNTLGQLCMLSGFTLAWCFFQARRTGHKLVRLYPLPVPVDLIYAGMLLYLLNAGGHSRSSTSLVCLVLAVLMLWLLGRFHGKERKIFPVFLTCLVGFGFAALMVDLIVEQSLVDLIAPILGKDSTLTGRDWLWADAIRLGMRHPFGGYGYGGFWQPWVRDQLNPLVDYGPGQCHNGYLETFVNLGLVGVVVLCLAVLVALRRAADLCRVDFESGRLRFALLFTIVVLNYTEATFSRGTHLFWFVFLMAALFSTPGYQPETSAVRPGRRRPLKNYRYGRLRKMPPAPQDAEIPAGEPVKRNLRHNPNSIARRRV
jgi:O-antigen ligase